MKFKDSVSKDLRKIDKAQIKRILKKIQDELSGNPQKGKPLKENFEGLYSYRVSEYRIIYTILEKDNSVLVLKVGHRKNIYK